MPVHQDSYQRETIFLSEKILNLNGILRTQESTTSTLN